MKIAVVCALNDTIDIEVIKENDPLQLMDLMAVAMSAKRKLVIANIDNSGVVIERQYPREEVGIPPTKAEVPKVDENAGRK